MIEQAVQKRIFTHEEFGAFTEKMEEVGGCFEFVDGQIVPKEDDIALDAATVEMILSDDFNPELLPKLTVPTREHDDIVSNLLMLLMTQLMPKGFRVYGQKTLFRIEGFGQTREPDIVIVPRTGQQRNRQHEVLNPIVLIEVLSKSTAKTDKITKVREYQSVDSVQEYVIVSQTEMRVTLYRRTEQGDWQEHTATILSDAITLSSVEATISLADIYNHVDFS